MLKRQLFARNLLYTFSSRGLEIIAGLVVIALLTRFFDLKTYGNYSVLMAGMWVLFPIVNLGYPRILVREIAQHPKKTSKYLRIGYTWNILVILLLFILILLFSFRLSSDDVVLYCLLVANVAIMSLTQTTASANIAFQKMHYETWPTFLTMVLLVCFIGIVVLLHQGLPAVLLAYALAYLAGLLLTLKFATRLFPWKQKLTPDINGIQQTFRESFFIGLFQLLVQLYLYSGIFILKALASYDDVAIFQAPFRIFTRLQIIPMSFMPVLLPVFAKLFADSSSKEEFKKTSRSIFLLMFIISLFLAISCFFLADRFIPLLLGASFIPSAAVFKILSLSICFFFLNTIFDTLFIASKNIRYLTLVQLGGVLVCSCANLILVPNLSFYGSSWAILISSGSMFVANALCFRQISFSPTQ